MLMPLLRKVSPTLRLSTLATAPIPPAGRSGTSLCSLPWSLKRLWSRTLPPPATSSSWSALTVPEKIRNIEMRPTKGSDTVLKT